MFRTSGGEIRGGWNEAILNDAIGSGLIAEKDVLLYGRHTRPVFKSLQYFTDPFVPDISNNESGAISLLQMLGIPLKDGEKWRTLTDLGKGGKAADCRPDYQQGFDKCAQGSYAACPGLSDR